MNIKPLSFLFVFAATTFISGCAVSHNPREGGLAGGVNGVFSGQYEKRVQQRKLLYEEQVQTKKGLEQQSIALNDQAQIEKSKLATEQQQMTKLNSDLASIEVELDNLQQKSYRQKNEINSAKARIEVIRKKMESQEVAISQIDSDSSTSIQSDRLKTLQAERERLLQEYSALLEYTQALANVPD